MTAPKRARGERLITVCDRCMRACCWQGVFFCDEARAAGTVEITIAKARELGLEHSDYWREAR